MMTEKLEVSVAKMEVQVERLEQDVAEMKGDLKAIRKTLDSATGGWRMLLIVGGISATIGGLIAKVVAPWVIGK